MKTTASKLETIPAILLLPTIAKADKNRYFYVQFPDMPETDTFSETQKFMQKWIFAILATLLVILAALTIYAFLSHEQDYWILVPALVVIVLLLVLFRQMTLSLKVDTQSISYRFSPFHWKYSVIAKEDIQAISVINYNPIGDYGGWGIRLGRKGRAYTVSGNSGICIELTNRKQLLIGTAKPKEIDSFLNQYWQEKLA